MTSIERVKYFMQSNSRKAALILIPLSFWKGAPPRELALVGTKAASSGVVISTYRPSGDLRTGSFDNEEA